ncbi:dipeptide ABC transporter ATP-binding protein [Phytoactinopolyspora endophytica]|uniref:dipeptide ABC transporter ATP-binding protein n=1 Tax=Phytoactinopolyspora endophytica TaxID=1642495 RepID=UPI00101BE8BA|nr:ABC transporter ATP-binding protein [Phytoactinopolyspora endophytica]
MSRNWASGRDKHDAVHNAASTGRVGAEAVTGALLSVRELAVEFRNRRGEVSAAVNRLDMEVPVGGAVAIVGESGSGKTVSMRAMLRLLPETAQVSGSALLAGEDLLALPEPKLRAVRGQQVGMVFQNAMSALNPTRTLKVQLTEHLRWHGIATGREATQRAVEALDRVGIPEPAERIRMYPFQLSGGQRQRAMIAMAIVAGPQLLIADEPTTALDVTVQRQVLDVLKQLREDGMATVMITHDLGVAKYLCDEVVVMRHGDVVESAPVRTFITNAQHAYSQQLLDTALDVDTTADERDTSFATADKGATTGAPARGARTEVPAVNVGEQRRDVETSRIDESGTTVTAEGYATELIWAQDLAKVFHGRGGDVHAVTDVNFAIAARETLGVVGESGSGKSTLARLITRLVEPSAGSVSFDGHDMLTAAGRELKGLRRRVQMVFQNPYASLLPHLTVAANVHEPLRVHGVGSKAEREARAVELLDLVGIPRERVNQYPRQFSGGQQQRVAIARALALEPELLVCDEPTSALDVSIQAQVLDLLEDLQSRLGLSMLFITHNLAVAQRLCDRIIVMASGHIMETASTPRLFGRPQHPYTQALLAAVLPIHGEPPPWTHNPDVAVDTSGELVETSPGHWVRMSVNGRAGRPER